MTENKTKAVRGMSFGYGVILCFVFAALLLAGCSASNETELSQEPMTQSSDSTASSNRTVDASLLTEGTEQDRGFILDNVYHSADHGDIHYNVRFPEKYDQKNEMALFITLPGWEGLYFQGVGANLVESFGFTATDYIEDMIVIAPQLDDWDMTSAEQTVALTEFFLDCYSIDRSRVFIEGLSAGGETLSLVLDLRPELYTAALHVASQWDGGYEATAQAMTPLRFAIGEDDSYYGSGPAKEAYEEIRKRYKSQGLSEDEIDSLLVLDVRDHDYFESQGYEDEHMGAGLFADDEETMGWLFSQRKALS